MSTDDNSPGLLGKLFKRSTDSLSGEDSDIISDKEHELSKAVMVDAAKRFHLITVEDVMVPRANIVAVDKSATLTELSLPLKRRGIRACLFIKIRWMSLWVWCTSKT